MLLSDGITLFGSDCTYRAYNVFIKHPQGSQNVAGGARTRTFKVMSCLIGEVLLSHSFSRRMAESNFRGQEMSKQEDLALAAQAPRQGSGDCD